MYVSFYVRPLCKVAMGVIPVSLPRFAYDARSRCHSLVWLRRDRENSFIPFLARKRLSLGLVASP